MRHMWKFVAAVAGLLGFVYGAWLSYAFAVHLDPTWAWIDNLTLQAWASLVMPPFVSLVLVALSTWWAWRIFGASVGGRVVLVASMATWWFTWWLVPVFNVDVWWYWLQETDGATNPEPADSALWAFGMFTSFAYWVLLLAVTVWRPERFSAPDTTPPAA